MRLSQTIYSALLFLAFSIPAAGFSPALHAEEASVQVDLSVLLNKQPTGFRATEQPVKEDKPSLVSPAGSISSPLDDPETKNRSQNKYNTVQHIDQKRAPARKATAQELIVFPVTVRNPKESFDPSLEKSRPATGGETGNVATSSLYKPPLPTLKPVPVAINTHKQNAPVPARRPAKSITTSLKATDVDIDTEAPKFRKTATNRVVDLSHAKKEMPAIPADKVDSEMLAKAAMTTTPKPMPKDNSPLGRQLVTPDKIAMVKSIESIAAFVDALSPSTSSTKRTKKKLSRTAAANINAPLPPRKPSILNVPLPTPIAHSEIIDITEKATEDFTQIEPAAGTVQNSKGQQFISFPLSTEANDNLNQAFLEAIDEKIITTLRNNPNWFLQIQSFAGATEKTAQNARRLSLSRALAVRTHLLERGVEAHRVDIRALGTETNRTPADRIDFILFAPEAGN